MKKQIEEMKAEGKERKSRCPFEKDGKKRQQKITEEVGKHMKNRTCVLAKKTGC